MQKPSVVPEQPRNLELDGVPGRVRKVYRLDLAAVRKGLTKTGEREWRHNVRTFEKFWVVTDLPELHHQVHERASRIGITKVCRLGKQVGDRDVGSEDFVQLPLSGTEINVDVDLNLGLCEHQQMYDSEG